MISRVIGRTSRRASGGRAGYLWAVMLDVWASACEWHVACCAISLSGHAGSAPQSQHRSLEPCEEAVSKNRVGGSEYQIDAHHAILQLVLERIIFQLKREDHSGTVCVGWCACVWYL